MKALHLTLSLLLIIPVPGLAQSGSEKKEVLQVVQQLFNAMAAQDTVAATNTLIPNGQFFAVQHKNDSVRVARRSHEQFVGSLVNKERRIEERMRGKEVQVQIHQQIAMVWAPYDFFVDKKFSHCGVDIFTLIKTNAGWKIASLVYTVEPEGCQQKQKAK